MIFSSRCTSLPPAPRRKLRVVLATVDQIEHLGQGGHDQYDFLDGYIGTRLGYRAVKISLILRAPDYAGEHHRQPQGLPRLFHRGNKPAWCCKDEVRHPGRHSNNIESYVIRGARVCCRRHAHAPLRRPPRPITATDAPATAAAPKISLIDKVRADRLLLFLDLHAGKAAVKIGVGLAKDEAVRQREGERNATGIGKRPG